MTGRNSRNTGPQPTLTQVAPPVTFATEDARHNVVGNLRHHHDTAIAHADEQDRFAAQAAAEQARIGQASADLRQQIAEAERQITENDRRAEEVAQQQHNAEAYAQQARDVAAGDAQILALAGAPVPPQEPAGTAAWGPDGQPLTVEEQAQRAVWNGQGPPQTGVWDPALPQSQEEAFQRLQAEVDPSPDPEL